MSESHFICFARNCICISTDDKRSAELAALLFHDVYSPGPVEPHTTIRLSHRESNGFYYLFYNGEPGYVGYSEKRVLHDVMDKAVYALADKATEGLLFHAAALWWNEKVVLLPGESGSGKSSLAAWLAHEGFGYLTDELVFVSLDTSRVDAFARPLNIKTPGLKVVESFLDLNQSADQLLHCIGATLIPHRLLNPDFKQRQSAPLGLIVFPKYQADAETNLQEISGAEASVRLMALLVNARNLHGHGFSETARLAKHIPTYSLVYSQFSSVADRIRSIMDTSASAALDSGGTTSAGSIGG